MCFNQIQVIPDAIANITTLERINASFNPLDKDMPESLCRTTSLVELNLDFTQVGIVPEAAGQLTKLEALQMEGCPFEYPFGNLYSKHPLLPVKVFDTEIRYLDLSKCGLKKVPTLLGRLTNLTELNLQNNNIQIISQYNISQGLKH